MVENSCDTKYRWIHFVDHDLEKEIKFWVNKTGECFDQDFNHIGWLVKEKVETPFGLMTERSFKPKEGFEW